MLEDLIGMITKHLKKGERVKIAGPRHSGGAQARRPHGPQSGDRRGDQDQGQQESRLPRRQGSEDGDLTAAPFRFSKAPPVPGGVFV